MFIVKQDTELSNAVRIVDMCVTMAKSTSQITTIIKAGNKKCFICIMRWQNF